VATHIEKPPVMHPVDERTRTPAHHRLTGSKPWRFLKQLAHAVADDEIDSVGAMMAYYAVLALFPMIVFIITLAMLIVDASSVEQGLAMIERVIPPAAASVIQQQVVSLFEAAGTGFAIGSAVFALWGASRGTVALSSALNRVYNKKETRPWWKRQVIAIAVTAGVALMILAALLLLVVGPIAGHWFADRFGLGNAFDVGWGIARWVGAGLLVMLVWAILYKFLPDTQAPFRIFTPGAVIGVALWLGISALFGIYLDNFGNYDATYGALGGAFIFLSWLWLSNIALLFGAEINDVLADFRKHESAAAAQLAAETDPAAKPGDSIGRQDLSGERERERG
jgi:membrane protein